MTDSASWLVVAVVTGKEGGFAGQLLELTDLPPDLAEIVKVRGGEQPPCSASRLSDVLRQLAQQQTRREEVADGVSRLRQKLGLDGPR